MNFSPAVKAWILLICLIISTGGGVGMTAFLGGANWKVAVITGFITGVTNLYHALSQSPKDKMSSGNTTPPIPPAS